MLKLFVVQTYRTVFNRQVIAKFLRFCRFDHSSFVLELAYTYREDEPFGRGAIAGNSVIVLP